MCMSHSVSFRHYDVAKVCCILKGCIGFLAADPLGKEVRWVFNVGNVSDVDLAATEAL